MVSVVIIATVSVTGTMMTRINSWNDVNEESYLTSIAENILSSKGFPADWGSNGSVKPEEFGLAESSSASTIELDLDKVSRLNPENYFSLSYTDILTAARLTDVAMSISVSQIMQIAISLASSTSQGNSTSYTFKVAVNQDSGPVTASLSWYAVARNFLQHQYGNTSTDGVGYVKVQNITNESNGTVALIVFARAAQDPMMTAYGVQLFSHPSQEPLQDSTFLNLSPLNYTLHLGLKSANTTVETSYAFSYGYQATLTKISNTSYTIPRMLDSSPTVLVVTGLNQSDFFAEWTAYPQVPFQTGSNFTNSESHTFSYVVIIKDTLYMLTLSFGDVNP
jgi:hypothetical protein